MPRNVQIYPWKNNQSYFSVRPLPTAVLIFSRSIDSIHDMLHDHNNKESYFRAGPSVTVAVNITPYIFPDQLIQYIICYITRYMYYTTIKKNAILERDHLRQLLENDSKNSSLAPSMQVTVALRQVGFFFLLCEFLESG